MLFNKKRRNKYSTIFNEFKFFIELNVTLTLSSIIILLIYKFSLVMNYDYTTPLNLYFWGWDFCTNTNTAVNDNLVTVTFGNQSNNTTPASPSTRSAWNWRDDC